MAWGKHGLTIWDFIYLYIPPCRHYGDRGSQKPCIASPTFTVCLLILLVLLPLTRAVLAAFGTIGGALFGFDVSSMSAWIGADQYLDYFDSPDSNLQGGITASMSAGSFGGAIAAGFISDSIGRRLSLMIASAVWIIGAVIQCSTHSIAQLVAGRVISGLAGE